MNRTRVVYAVLGVILAAFVFQVFLRYHYLAASGVVYRADRLTGRVCQVAPYDSCAHPFPPQPTPCVRQPGESAVHALMRC
jgi:hypothetical protein